MDGWNPVTGTRAIVAAVLCLIAAGPAIAAKAQYTASGRTLHGLDIRSDAPETDALLIVTCVAPGTLDVRIGGELPLGDGEHKPASVTLSDGALSVKVDGVSVRSPDQEMTGGVMLLTSLDPKGKAWRILISGKPIEIRTGSGTNEKISLGKSVTDALKALAGKCS